MTLNPMWERLQERADYLSAEPVDVFVIIIDPSECNGDAQKAGKRRLDQILYFLASERARRSDVQKYKILFSEKPADLEASIKSLNDTRCCYVRKLFFLCHGYKNGDVSYWETRVDAHDFQQLALKLSGRDRRTTFMYIPLMHCYSHENVKAFQDSDTAQFHRRINVLTSVATQAGDPRTEKTWNVVHNGYQVHTGLNPEVPNNPAHEATTCNCKD